MRYRDVNKAEKMAGTPSNPWNVESQYHYLSITKLRDRARPTPKTFATGRSLSSADCFASRTLFDLLVLSSISCLYFSLYLYPFAPLSFTLSLLFLQHLLRCLITRALHYHLSPKKASLDLSPNISRIYSHLRGRTPLSLPVFLKIGNREGTVSAGRYSFFIFSFHIPQLGSKVSFHGNQIATLTSFQFLPRGFNLHSFFRITP